MGDFFALFGFTNLKFIKKFSRLKYEQNNCCKDLNLNRKKFKKKMVEWG
jgi:hypothetical protein